MEVWLITYLLWTLRLIISPALHVCWGSRCSSDTSVGLGSITRYLYPFLRRGEVVLVIPILLSGSVGASFSTESRIWWNAFNFMGSACSIDGGSSS
jgi:hypothetical protein